MDKKNMMSGEEDIMQEMFNRWTGKNNSKNDIKQEMKEENINESNEPYIDMEPISAVIKLPFEVTEGDNLDMNAIIKKINEDGTAEIEINKAFKK